MRLKKARKVYGSSWLLLKHNGNAVLARPQLSFRWRQRGATNAPPRKRASLVGRIRDDVCFGVLRFLWTMPATNSVLVLKQKICPAPF